MAYRDAEKRKESQRKYRLLNRGRRTAYTRQWRLDHPEQTKNMEQSYYARNREKILAHQKARNLLNPEKRKETMRNSSKKNRELNRGKEFKKYHTDPKFKLEKILRSRVRGLFRGISKSAATFELLGCSVSELWAHLESKFVPGMARENHGPVWHVDHIKPCASFDLSDPAQQRECFHYTNLQPLFALDNLKKGVK